MFALFFLIATLLIAAVAAILILNPVTGKEAIVGVESDVNPISASCNSYNEYDSFEEFKKINTHYEIVPDVITDPAYSMVPGNIYYDDTLTKWSN